MSTQNLEGFLRNSIPLTKLIQEEEKGLGNITITQLLDRLQDLYLSGSVDNHYDILASRTSPTKAVR